MEKGDGLGDQGERHHETCQQVVSDVGKPVLAECV